jgi:hypothetical protein
MESQPGQVASLTDTYMIHQVGQATMPSSACPCLSTHQLLNPACIVRPAPPGCGALLHHLNCQVSPVTPPCCSLAHRYHQCLPGSGSGSGTAAGALALWAQCGGKGGDCSRYTCLDGIYPGQSCPSGSNCYKLSEWYSQCRPTGSSFGSCEQVRGMHSMLAVTRAACATQWISDVWVSSCVWQ